MILFHQTTSTSLVSLEHHHIPRRNKKGGGVAVFVRKYIDCMLCQTQPDTFESESSQFLVHVIYRPPSTSKCKFISWDMSISILTVETAVLIISTQFQSDFDFIQHVSTPTPIYGHILDLLCTSKSLNSSVCHYVKDGVSDLAVFFTYPVRNSCTIKCSEVRKISKINKCEFISDIDNSELVQAPYKTASLLSH